MKYVKLGGRLQPIANPSAVPGECASTRKPVSKISDRAKRYRANQAGCLPSSPKRCLYCKSRRSVEVHHADGNESNGAKSNLRWACRACNTKIGLAMKAAGKGKRTRQRNPAHVPDFKQYAWAVGLVCRKRDQEKGLCSPSSDPLTLEAVEVIRATPRDVRREYAARAAASRGSSFSEVPF